MAAIEESRLAGILEGLEEARLILCDLDMDRFECLELLRAKRDEIEKRAALFGTGMEQAKKEGSK